MIAMALACEPKLLIADEPTTALDVTIQRQILELLAGLKDKHRMSVLFISHDLGVVGEIADHVVVMRQGTVREQGPVARIFSAPQDAYTQALLACRPTLDAARARLPVIDDQSRGPTRWRAGGSQGCGRAGLIERRVAAQESLAPQWRVRVQDDSKRSKDEFPLRRGRTLGVVGESGSGKTTLGLTLCACTNRTAGWCGQVMFDADLLARERHDGDAPAHPGGVPEPVRALNPRFTVGQTLTEPMNIHTIGNNDPEREGGPRVARPGGPVRCGHGQVSTPVFRRPAQRVAIARCLTLKPEVLVLDEAVSALDVRCKRRC